MESIISQLRIILYTYVDFVPSLGVHGVFLAKRRACQVPGQSPKLVGPHGVPEFHLGLALVDAVVVVRVLEIHYYPPVLARSSSCWADFGPERPETSVRSVVRPVSPRAFRRADCGLLTYKAD